VVWLTEGRRCSRCSDDRVGEETDGDDEVWRRRVVLLCSNLRLLVDDLSHDPSDSVFWALDSGWSA
jgi:hypothetical protein